MAEPVRRFTGHPRLTALATAAIAALTLAGCGGAADPALSEAAQLAAISEPAGADVFARTGCVNCHSVDGTPRAGPTLAGIAGAEVALTDGSAVLRDRDYLARSLQDPDAQIVDGFRATMPTYDLEPDEMEALLDYLDALALP